MMSSPASSAATSATLSALLAQLEHLVTVRGDLPAAARAFVGMRRSHSPLPAKAYDLLVRAYVEAGDAYTARILAMDMRRLQATPSSIVKVMDRLPQGRYSISALLDRPDPHHDAAGLALNLITSSSSSSDISTSLPWIIRAKGFLGKLDDIDSLLNTLTPLQRSSPHILAEIAWAYCNNAQPLSSSDQSKAPPSSVPVSSSSESALEYLTAMLDLIRTRRSQSLAASSTPPKSLSLEPADPFNGGSSGFKRYKNPHNAVHVWLPSGSVRAIRGAIAHITHVAVTSADDSKLAETRRLWESICDVFRWGVAFHMDSASYPDPFGVVLMDDLKHRASANERQKRDCAAIINDAWALYASHLTACMKNLTRVSDGAAARSRIIEAAKALSEASAATIANVSNISAMATTSLSALFQLKAEILWRDHVTENIMTGRSLVPQVWQGMAESVISSFHAFRLRGLSPTLGDMHALMSVLARVGPIQARVANVQEVYDTLPLYNLRPNAETFKHVFASCTLDDMQDLSQRSVRRDPPTLLWNRRFSHLWRRRESQMADLNLTHTADSLRALSTAVSSAARLDERQASDAIVTFARLRAIRPLRELRAQTIHLLRALSRFPGPAATAIRELSHDVLAAFPDDPHAIHELFRCAHLSDSYADALIVLGSISHPPSILRHRSCALLVKMAIELDERAAPSSDAVVRDLFSRLRAKGCMVPISALTPRLARFYGARDHLHGGARTCLDAEFLADFMRVVVPDECELSGRVLERFVDVLVGNGDRQAVEMVVRWITEHKVRAGEAALTSGQSFLSQRKN